MNTIKQTVMPVQGAQIALQGQLHANICMFGWLSTMAEGEEYFIMLCAYNIIASLVGRSLFKFN